MADPILDPKTGDVNAQGGGGASAGGGDFVPRADFEALKTKLDAFEQGFSLARQQAQQPQMPQQPAGPTLAEQIGDIDSKIKPLNAAIDEAISEGKPVSALLTQRDDLVSRRNRLQIVAEDIAPVRDFAASNIDALSSTVTQGSMPYLSLVQDEMNSMLSQLRPEQRANPQVRMKTYELAVGANLEKILAAKKEEFMRAAAPDPALDTTANSRGKGYVDSAGKAIPNPKEVLSPASMAAIRSKGQTVDEYYRRLGYTGWADFYEKTGRDYFSEGEEA